MALSVVSACLPTLRPLFTHYFSSSPNKDSLPLSSPSGSGSRFGRNPRFSDKQDNEILMNTMDGRGVDTLVEALERQQSGESDNAIAISIEQHMEQQISRV